MEELRRNRSGGRIGSERVGGGAARMIGVEHSASVRFVRIMTQGFQFKQAPSRKGFAQKRLELRIANARARIDCRESNGLSGPNAIDARNFHHDSPAEGPGS